MTMIMKKNPLDEFSVGDIVVAIGSVEKYFIQAINMDMARSDPFQFTLYDVDEPKNHVVLPGWVLVGDWLKVDNMFAKGGEDDDEDAR